MKNHSIEEKWYEKETYQKEYYKFFKDGQNTIINSFNIIKLYLLKTLYILVKQTNLKISFLNQILIIEEYFILEYIMNLIIIKLGNWHISIYISKKKY